MLILGTGPSVDGGRMTGPLKPWPLAPDYHTGNDDSGGMEPARMTARGHRPGRAVDSAMRSLDVQPGAERAAMEREDHALVSDAHGVNGAAMECEDDA